MLVDVAASRRRRRFVAAAEVIAPLVAAPPRDAVRVVVDDGVLLCGPVADLAALRQAVGEGPTVRCLSFEALVARRPRGVEPAS
jgi:hypothetical protein